MKVFLECFCLLCLCACHSSRKAEIVLKDYYIYEHYQPVVYRESKYLLANLADEIKSDYRLDNGDWHFSIDLRDRAGEFFYLQDMIVFLQPDTKLEIECNQRNRHESIFKGELEKEAYWLNQSMLRGANTINPCTSRDLLSWSKYCEDVNRMADSLQEEVRTISKSRKYIQESRERLDLIRVVAYCMYVDRVLNTQKFNGNFESEEAFSEWKKQQMTEIEPQIVEKVSEVLKKYSENDILRNVHGQRALISVGNLQKGVLESFHFDQFRELMDYRNKLEDPNFEYSAEMVEYAKHLQDTCLRRHLQQTVTRNQDLVEGTVMNDFEFEDVDGKKHRLSDYKGMPIYLDIWATWCNPCKAISPNFAALADTYARKGIKFIAISIDKNTQALRDYVKKHDEHRYVEEWHCVDKVFLEKYRISSIPRFLLIDKDFKIRMAFAYKPIEFDMKNLTALLDEMSPSN